MTVPEVFQKEGRTIAVEGNKPLLMTDPEHLWMVDQGRVTVFTVFVADGEAVGSRDFLFEAGPGDLLMGIRPEGADRALGLMATGLTGTSLLQLSWSGFLEAAAVPNQREVLLNAVSHWAGTIAEVAAAAEAPGLNGPAGCLRLRRLMLMAP